MDLVAERRFHGLKQKLDSL
jgi:centrosomal protein CEP135